MLSSTTKSPISMLPYDVLREIFVHCLPRYPLQNGQCNTKIAPMLLCQICSSWRMVALTSAILWSHLSYCFTVVENPDVMSSWSSKLLKKEIEFVQWWKRNQGSIAPFIYLGAVYVLQSDMTQEPLMEDLEDNMTFLLQYLTPAQYLRIDSLYWYQIRKAIRTGYQVVFPNLHTLVRDRMDEDYDDTDAFYGAQTLIGLVPNRLPSSLRRLVIEEEILPFYGTIIPNHWSTLTHLSVSYIDLSLDFWFSLIRAVPDLQWGYFHVNEIYVEDDRRKPTKCALPQLSSLFVHVCGLSSNSNPGQLLISLLFTNLHLPALHTLSLSCYDRSWCDNRAITELSTILKFTPAITTLALGEGYFSPGSDTFTAGDMEPIWSCAAQLAHLQLVLPNNSSKSEEKAVDTLITCIHNSFDNWMSACPVRTITLIDSSRRISSSEVDPIRFYRIRDLVMSSIRSYSSQAPNITFQIIPRSKSPIEKASMLWRTWDSRV